MPICRRPGSTSETSRAGTRWISSSPQGGALAVEVKAASRFGERDLSGLKAWKAQSPEARAGILAYNGTEALPLGGDLFAIPLGLLLS